MGFEKLLKKHKLKIATGTLILFALGYSIRDGLQSMFSQDHRGCNLVIAGSVLSRLPIDDQVGQSMVVNSSEQVLILDLPETNGNLSRQPFMPGHSFIIATSLVQPSDTLVPACPTMAAAQHAIANGE